MTHRKPLWQHFVAFCIFLPALLTLSCRQSQSVVDFNPPDNSTIIFIGNTFAERLQYNNYFETLLYQSFPAKNLKVRNLAWSADEITLRPRPLGFGSLEEADEGFDCLYRFSAYLQTLLSQLYSQSVNGNIRPQLRLISPIDHEDLDGFLPNPEEHNRSLSAYTKEMGRVAADLDSPFL